MNLGVQLNKNGADFTIHSTMERLWLMLFDQPDAEMPEREIEMTRIQESGVRGQESIFHAYVPEVKPGSFYLYRADPGPWLLDPCARAVHTPNRWGDPTGTTAGHAPKSGKMFPKGVLVADNFSWGKDQRPQTALEDSVIYEAHLRGFTRGEADGTYLDFIEKIPYLQELGITAVEFLPLFEFNELEYHLRGDSRKKMLNFWGYSTLAFFAPMSRYARSSEPGAAVTEFKTLVQALHAADIEVILDVVFNHTAESERNGPVYHFRKLDEKAYYMQDPDGTYHNWSGCGNTFNANHPIAIKFIVDCLKYWTQEMHIDGFRFDLATTLCRGENGNVMESPPLIRALEAEPALKNVKLIAEAWDLKSYQVGQFPGKRFSDWNGRYRDDVRRFWNHGTEIGPLATRLCGSSDLYGHFENGSPLKSINFITAHDGFTLADLVSYKHKHNEANGEDNRDGENHNDSVNFGIEGPTDDPSINARRLQQQKNLLASLFLSQGVPMLLAGDEFGRTQQGNNNAYCQDNEISWVDGSQLGKTRELFEFTQKLIALRKAHPALRRKTFFADKSEVEWLGPDGKEPDWKHGHTLGMHLLGKDELLILINNEHHDVASFFSEQDQPAPIPGSEPGGKDSRPNAIDWKLELATTDITGLTLPPHSLAVYIK